MGDEDPSKIEKLKAKIAQWKNRVLMARQAGKEDLVLRAQEQVQQLENQLAVLQEFETD